ncbi:Histone-fold domain containing protein [Cordyceps fumosorosea ARSEF 2679]|uniref:NCT transcriptional regulatory complex subunit A n=1 Tax=Cordyceps fumosorosea (strain ARSEF 2679) TaxID=1081104 RepID=A0A167LRV0_CORFA|nr:Histone-fold domain containing protein [Cordyceps fumosorosea ARSEF 2679]OAA53422.1 Histone-fold domain containing protein [Cordyceps fumosorosea ARSEF 2679]
MSGDDTSYAPKSPDFSSFFSGPSDQAPPLDLGPSSHSQQFQSPSFGYTSSYVPPTSTSFKHGGYGVGSDSYLPPTRLQQQHSFSQTLGDQPSYGPETHRQDPGQLPVVPTAFGDPYPQTRSQKQPQRPAAEPETKRMPPRKAAKEPSPPAPPIIDSSMVKTKFPTARIKRIMQADEEVGKVAQQTPIAVGKALELFMIQLVSRSAEVAKDKGSRRVTASMLKQVVESDEQWDFLRDIVSRVENEKETVKKEPKPKAESDSEDEQPKRRRGERGAGRKKKAC